jgi:hypothetical protein
MLIDRELVPLSKFNLIFLKKKTDFGVEYFEENYLKGESVKIYLYDSFYLYFSFYLHYFPPIF